MKLKLMIRITKDENRVIMGRDGENELQMIKTDDSASENASPLGDETNSRNNEVPEKTSNDCEGKRRKDIFIADLRRNIEKGKKLKEKYGTVFLTEKPIDYEKIVTRLRRNGPYSGRKNVTIICKIILIIGKI